jgi:hypothetical protein
VSGGNDEEPNDNDNDNDKTGNIPSNPNWIIHAIDPPLAKRNLCKCRGVSYSERRIIRPDSSSTPKRV